MAEQSTYIKIDRNIERWRWWQNSKTLHVFMWLLLNANVKDHEFEHEMIRRGQVAASYSTLVKSTTLTLQEVRTAFLHLKSTGEITSRSCGRFQVITIVNYDLYQKCQQGKQQEVQQAINRVSTGYQQQYKNDKNDKNGKNKKGRSAPDPPSGIPEMYRDRFATVEEYEAWRNQ